jgi:AP2 domain
MKQIELSNSKTVVTVVDDEDFERLNRHRWLLSPKGYIIRYEGSSYNRVQIQMHNELLRLCRPFRRIDHINGCKWDNTKANLRLVSPSVNQQNRRTNSRNSTGYKGVSYNPTHRSYKKFKASINKDYRSRTIGYYVTAKEAAEAYDKVALEIYGPEALTNHKIRNGG